MAYLFDIAVILVFGLMVFLGHRNGFIKTVTGLIAFTVALVLSVALAGPVAELGYTTLVEPPVAEALESHMGDDSLAVDQLDAALAEMPAFVTEQLAAQGIESGADALQYLGAAEEGESAADSVMRQIIRPVTLPVLEAVGGLLLFFLLQLILTLILKLMNLLAKLPLLKQANKALGFVAGIVQGVLWALLIAMVLGAVADTGLIPLISTDAVESTTVVKWLNEINPLADYMADLMVVS